MPLNWKPELWGQLAQKDPDAFLQELRGQKPPTAVLFTKTYIACIREGFKGMQRHPKCSQTLSGAVYEEEYFTLLLKLLPHENAKKPDDYDITTLRNCNSERAPIEFERWFDALSHRLNPSKKPNPIHWILSLRKPSYESFQGAHEHFSLKNAPEWAKGYVEIQRGLPSTRLQEWLRTGPMDPSITLVNTLANLQDMRSQEQPAWLSECIESVLSRQEALHRDATVFATTSLMAHAMARPSIKTDQLIVALICGQPKGMSLLTHQWFGFKHEKNRHELMEQWWSRQSAQDRGAILERWWSDVSVWDTLKSETPGDGTPLVAVDLFTKYPVEFTSEQAKHIVHASALNVPLVRSCLSRLVPAIAAAELMVEPDKLKDYLLQTWDHMRQDVRAWSVDGLLEIQP